MLELLHRTARLDDEEISVVMSEMVKKRKFGQK